MAQNATARRQPPRSDGLDAPADRVAALETAVAEIRQILYIQFKRMATMQAELDRLRAHEGQT